MNQPALLFVRTRFRLIREFLSGFSLLNQSLASCMAFRRFLIQQAGFAGRFALLRQARDGQLPPVRAFRNGNTITDFDVLSGFASLAVQMHFSAGDRFSRELPGFKKSRGPKPFIESLAARSFHKCFLKRSSMSNSDPIAGQSYYDPSPLGKIC